MLEIILSLLLLVYIFVDVNYFISMAITIGINAFLQSKIRPQEEQDVHVTYGMEIKYLVFLFNLSKSGWKRCFYFKIYHFFLGIVLPWDVDLSLDHLNNARFIRQLDFCRMALGTRTGVTGPVYRAGGSFPVNSNFIRYRLPVKLFSLYKVWKLYLISLLKMHTATTRY